MFLRFCQVLYGFVLQGFISYGVYSSFGDRMKNQAEKQQPETNQKEYVRVFMTGNEGSKFHLFHGCSGIGVSGLVWRPYYFTREDFKQIDKGCFCKKCFKKSPTWNYVSELGGVWSKENTDVSWKKKYVLVKGGLFAPLETEGV